MEIRKEKGAKGQLVVVTDIGEDDVKELAGELFDLEVFPVRLKMETEDGEDWVGDLEDEWEMKLFAGGMDVTRMF